MAADTKTFSDSWYRIAGGRVALRPHVQVRRQFFRGERYYVLHDPLNNQFFRLRPEAYAFVARLRLDRSIEEVWHECMEAHPEEAPGQGQVLKLLSQLHSSNLLHSHLSPDSAKMFERQNKRRQREAQATWMNVMFSRFPLVDPDAILKRFLPLIRAIFSPIGAVIWLAAVGAAVKVLIDHSGEVRQMGEAVLAPGNLMFLSTALIIIKVLHELGHATACRRFGGEVHVMGVMLMILVPMPYVDTTSSWSFRSRWQRALVGAAGMITELFIAAFAAFVWAGTGPGAVHSVAYNIVFIASVSTLIFNANPLLRFDGYYILSDLLEIPNLQGRAQRQIGYLFERYVFGLRQVRTVAASRREGIWLAVYGVASMLYRTFVSATILLFIGNRYLVLGLMALVICAVAWVAVPALRGLHYLLASPQLSRSRMRAIGATAGAVAVLFCALEVVPVSSHFRAPGILEAVQHSTVNAKSGGVLAEILAAPNGRVKQGDALLRLENRELDLEAVAAESDLREVHALRELALKEQAADLAPLDSRIASLEKRLGRIHGFQGALTIRAPHAGVWVPLDDLRKYRGAWLTRGMAVGQVINQDAFQFSAVVSQEEASHLFAREIRSAEVRLAGQPEIGLPVGGQTIIPAEMQNLPSAALGWRGGGDIAVAAGDSTGTLARERFFEVQARVQPPRGMLLIHGISGKIRFELPAEPLLSQWIRKLRQLLQKRGTAT